MLSKGNFGDDLLSLILAGHLLGEKDDLTLESLFPAKLASNDLVNERGSSRAIEDLFNTIRVSSSCDVLIIGPGGLFQDVHSSWNVFSYVWPLLFLPFSAPVYIVGISVGPVKHTFNQYLINLIFKAADYVHVRDEYSYLYSKQKCVKGYDLGLSFNVLDQPKADILAISVRDVEGFSVENFQARVNKLICKYNVSKIVFFIFEASLLDDSEEHFVRRISAGIDCMHIDFRDYNGDIQAFSRDWTECRYAISMRFHGIVLSLLSSQYFVPIVYSQKTQGLLDSVGFRGRASDLGCSESFEFVKHFVEPKKLPKFLGRDTTNSRFLLRVIIALILPVYFVSALFRKFEKKKFKRPNYES